MSNLHAAKSIGRKTVGIAYVGNFYKDILTSILFCALFWGVLLFLYINFGDNEYSDWPELIIGYIGLVLVSAFLGLFLNW